MKQLFYYFFASILIFSLIGCSSHTSKTELMIFKDNEIENINLFIKKNDDGHLINNKANTINESLIKDIVKTIKDGSPIKSRLDEKTKKSLNGEMEVNFKNGSKEILFVLISDKNEISVLKESGEGYKLKDNASKLVTSFFLGYREMEKTKLSKKIQ